MAKKHDEDKDLRSLAKVCKINVAEKSIIAPKNSLGLKRLGMLDFFCKLGWYVSYTLGNKKVSYTGDERDKKNVRQIKKEHKEHKLTDKTKR